jgi:hypothetical protein
MDHKIYNNFIDNILIKSDEKNDSEYYYSES